VRAHEYFRELATLRSSGGLTRNQFDELDEHMRGCAECRTVADQSDTIDLLLLEAAEHARPTQIPVHLSRKLHSQHWLKSQSINANTQRATFVRYLLIAAGLLLLLAGSFYVGRLTGHGSQDLVIRGPQPNLPGPTPTPAPVDQTTITDKLRKANAELQARTQELHAVQQNLDQLLQGRQELQARNSELSSENEKLKTQVANQQHELQAALADSSELRAKEQADHVAADLAETQLRQLQQSEAKLRQTVEEAKRVQALLSDAQKLMEDPNLHTLNVDEEVEGKKRQGHILCSERLCEFYAWNIGDVSATKQSIFNLWGQTEQKGQSRIVNLGQFELDNAEAGRWLLKFEPRLLSQISSVFVTREKRGNALQPTGERMLIREIAVLHQGR